MWTDEEIKRLIIAMERTAKATEELVKLLKNKEENN